MARARRTSGRRPPPMPYLHITLLCISHTKIPLELEQLATAACLAMTSIILPFPCIHAIHELGCACGWTTPMSHASIHRCAVIPCINQFIAGWMDAYLYRNPSCQQPRNPITYSKLTRTGPPSTSTQESLPYSQSISIDRVVHKWYARASMREEIARRDGRLHRRSAALPVPLLDLRL